MNIFTHRPAETDWKDEASLRSEVIYRASQNIANRYQLCKTVARAARLLHIAPGDMHKTINDVFIELSRTLPPAIATGQTQPTS
jgi:hypothetical protein